MKVRLLVHVYEMINRRHVPRYIFIGQFITDVIVISSHKRLPSFCMNQNIINNDGWQSKGIRQLGSEKGERMKEMHQYDFRIMQVINVGESK